MEIIVWEVFFGAFVLAFATLLSLILFYPHQIFKETLGKEWISHKSATLSMIFLTLGLRIGRFKQFENFDFRSKVPQWIIILCWLNVLCFAVTGIALAIALLVHRQQLP